MAELPTRLEYGQRAFADDANTAMKGELIRGLIELITNADDAYDGNPGDIHISLRKTTDPEFPVCAAVSDKAVGLTTDEMVEKIMKLGGTTSRLNQGGSSRGVFGRGAKDVVAFGKAVFASISSGAYTELHINAFDDCQWVSTDSAPTPEQRAALGLQEGESGLTAQILLSAQSVRRMESGRKLHEQLTRHVQLRQLIGRRPVHLSDYRVDGGASRLLEYPTPEASPLIDETLDLGTHGSVHLLIARLPDHPREALSAYSPQGIIVSDGAAAYENTLFGLEARTEAHVLTGEVICPQIPKLLTASGSSASELVQRTRDGLISSHPFVQELTLRIQDRLGPILESIAAEMGVQSDRDPDLDRSRADLKRELHSPISEILREIEAEGTGDEIDPENLPPIEIIPPIIRVPPGSQRTLSIRVRAGLDEALTASSSDNAVVSLDTGTLNSRKPHPRLNASVSAVRVTAQSLGTSQVSVRCGSFEAAATVIVETIDPSIPEPPEELRFERPSLQISPTRSRKVLLVAPLDSAAELVEIQSSRPGIAKAPALVELRPDQYGVRKQAVIRVEAGLESGSALITAVAQAETAACDVAVTETAAGSVFEWDFKVVNQTNYGQRSVRSPEGSTLMITIYGEDPSIKGLLGTYDEEAGSYTGSSAPTARAMLAELISLELAMHFVELLAQKRQPADATATMVRMASFQNRLVRQTHRTLGKSST
jgi:hypothetical protein